MRLTKYVFLVAAATACLSTAQPVPAVQTGNFTINVTFQPDVKALSARRGITPRISVFYSAAPKKQFRNELGPDEDQLVLGNEHQIVSPNGGNVALGKGLNRRELNKIVGPVEVSIHFLMGGGGPSGEVELTKTVVANGRTNDLACTGDSTRSADVIGIRLKLNDAMKASKRITCSIPKTGFFAPANRNDP